MTPVDQIFLREREQRGDCWRAAIASMLDMPREVVPHFLLEGDESKGSVDWMEMTRAFLHWHGYEMDIYAPTPEQRWVDLFGWLREKGIRYAILSGPSPRGVCHAVIWDIERDELAHDPHPSRAGIAYPWQDVAVIRSLKGSP